MSSRKILAKSFSKIIIFLVIFLSSYSYKHLSITEAKNIGNVNCVAFSPDGKILAAAKSDGTIGLWDAATGHKLRTFVCSYYALSIAFSPDGKKLVSGGDSGMITLWNTDKHGTFYVHSARRSS